jgi:hypothetical protein
MDAKTSIPETIHDFVFTQKDLEDFLDKFKRDYSKSGLFNLVNYYKGIHGFTIKSFERVFTMSEELNQFVWENESRCEITVQYDESLLPKKVQSKIARLLSKECKLVGWLNQNYLNRLFNVDMCEIENTFHKGTTILAKLSFFFNSLHKQKISEDDIMLLVHRIERISRGDPQVSNLFCYVKPRNVTFSNISQKNKLLKFNLKNLNMLTIGLNNNKKAKIKHPPTFDKYSTNQEKSKGVLVYF